MPSPRPNPAARPESRSLPTVIFAEGQISPHSFRKLLRSSSVAHPARNIPTRSASAGICRKIALSLSALVRRRLDGGSFPCSIMLNESPSFSTSAQDVFVPPPSTPRMRSLTVGNGLSARKRGWQGKHHGTAVSSPPRNPKRRLGRRRSLELIVPMALE